MEEINISGTLIRPDKTIEYWWNNKNYYCVLPEELIDAELEHMKKKEREEIKDEKESKQ